MSGLSHRAESTSPRYAPRGPLPPEVERAARTMYQAAYGQPYEPGRGVLHYGGGPAHAAHLRRCADRWERQATAARACAEWLGDEPTFPLSEEAEGAREFDAADRSWSDG